MGKNDYSQILIEIKEYIKENTQAIRSFNNRYFFLIVILIGLVAGKELILPIL